MENRTHKASIEAARARTPGALTKRTLVGHPHRQERRDRAAQRTAARTSAEQLAELDRRLGEGVGARRERVRLAKEV